MAIDYLKMRQTATRLLTANGAQYSAVRPGGVERVDGEEVISPPAEFTITGVLVSYKPAQIDGKNILTGDQQLTATAAIPVHVGDIVVIDGQQCRVVNPWPVKPAVLVLCYKLQLRGV